MTKDNKVGVTKTNAKKASYLVAAGNKHDVFSSYSLAVQQRLIWEKKLNLFVPSEFKGSFEELIQILFYQKDGVIFNKVNRPKVIANTPAGIIHSKDGYERVKIMGKRYYVHRVIWLLQYGRWPEKGLQIDHINSVRDDNRIENLQELTRKQNQAKRKKQIKNLVAGVNCVTMGKKIRYISTIRVNNKEKNLGFFDEHWDAICAKKSAELTETI